MTEHEGTSSSTEISPVDIGHELKDCYLSYAMSVIITRALPDARDGLKPVHRRILFAMDGLNNYYNRPYKKSARIVGDVIGKYHPHGDTAVYDALVRMAQDFSMRYPLVEGQGNFGSMDGDSPAAMRYTESRMSKISSLMIEDLEKKCVNFSPNYDDNETMPDVMPCRVPNLLVNGSQGIAVGMATDIPPHNLTEVCNAALALIDNPDIDIQGLMEFVTGPDFPTGGIINGMAGIRKAYETGNGTIKLRAKVDVINEGDRDTLIISEIPYQVNKAKMIEHIVSLTRPDSKVLTSISEIRDESDKDGVRVVIELKKGEIGEVVLNNLYQHTALQRVVKCNLVALNGRSPGIFNLKQLLQIWLDHRREVILRSTQYDLDKAKNRGHQLEGLSLALSNLDSVIELIRSSMDQEEAKQKLAERTWPLGDMEALIRLTGEKGLNPEDESIDFDKLGLQVPEGVDLEEYITAEAQYQLSPMQIRAILDMRLHRLTGLEQDELRSEYKKVVELIADLKDILSSKTRLTQELKEQIFEVVEAFGDERRTPILAVEEDYSHGDLIQPEERILTISNSGYVKAQPISEYRVQHRGGTGMMATKLKDNDYVEHFLTCNTHDEVYFFTNLGKVFKKMMYEFPPIPFRGSRGRPIVNLLQLEEGETITNVLHTSVGDEEEDNRLLVMATKFGVIKKTHMRRFKNIRKSGLIAINLRDGDQMIGAVQVPDDGHVLMVSLHGKALRFDTKEVREVSRGAIGVRGMKFREGDYAVSLLAPTEDQKVLVVTEHGYGKCTPYSEFTQKHRGGLGIIAMVTEGRNGHVVWSSAVSGDEDIALINNLGRLIRTQVSNLPVISRATKGVRVIRLKDKETLRKAVLMAAEPPALEDEENAEYLEGEHVDSSQAVDTDVESSANSASEIQQDSDSQDLESDNQSDNQPDNQ